MPDDGKYTGGDLTSLTFVSSSISPPYNGISYTIPIPILEERAIGVTVQILPPLAPNLFLREIGDPANVPHPELYFLLSSYSSLTSIIFVLFVFVFLCLSLSLFVICLHIRL